MKWAVIADNIRPVIEYTVASCRKAKLRCFVTMKLKLVLVTTGNLAASVVTRLKFAENKRQAISSASRIVCPPIKWDIPVNASVTAGTQVSETVANWPEESEA